MMRAAIILNRNAGSFAKAGPLMDYCKSVSGIDLIICESTKHGCDEVDRILSDSESRYDTLFAAGGDGTLHTLVNAAQNGLERVRFGLLPLGTGNDFSRTLGLSLDPVQALKQQLTDEERRFDLIRVTTPSRKAICVNLASGGFGGETEDLVKKEISKEFWGPLTYLRGAASIASDPTEYRVSLRVDGGGTREVSALNIVVANGRTAGGGFAVAPLARPDDGLMDLVIVHPAPALDLVGVVARLIAGDYTQSDAVTHLRARSVVIDAEPGMSFSLDGKSFSKESIRFEVLENALRFIAGKDLSLNP